MIKAEHALAPVPSWEDYEKEWEDKETRHIFRLFFEPHEAFLGRTNVNKSMFFVFNSPGQGRGLERLLGLYRNGRF